ncbi:MAG: helicase-exonuclease AddAB subunit AddA, partial [Lachnospiraceae bacterium]|nr:helicase-exonuclease AddAB subunit AddA [Lachnospiraceae bacterium]
PDDRYLRRQEALLPGAQITTIDSFCGYILHNHFSEIGLDPGFRQMEETEAQILKSDTLAAFLEEKYAEKDPAFLAMTEFFSPGLTDSALEERILQLYDIAVSHPYPERFLRERMLDYDVSGSGDLEAAPWFRELCGLLRDRLGEAALLYDGMLRISQEADGPASYLPILEEEEKTIRALLADDSYAGLKRAAAYTFPALPRIAGKKAEGISEEKKQAVRRMREDVKKTFGDAHTRFLSADLADEAEKMKKVQGALTVLLDTTAQFYAAYTERKRRDNVIDFADLEHLALQILLSDNGDGTYTARDTALLFRRYFEEIMIDEYQDSNEVQELLLKTISREEEGSFNRFMVGDVKQSIYKFRLARPEIFMDKFDRYTPGDLKRERIDLDQNFRSRKEVLDIVNHVFSRIMRREVGGVAYSDEVSLKEGARFPYPEGPSPYLPELVLVDGAESGEEADADDGEDLTLSSREKEALCIAEKIRGIVGTLPVRDEETGNLRPARYSDIVVLLRATSGWNEEFRRVFEMEGIPAHVTSRTGYFSAEEIRMILQLLRVLDNPRQDIPLYAVLRGYFGAFTEEEIARIRIGAREGLLYDALEQAGEKKDALAEKVRAFLERIRALRGKVCYLSLPELLGEILEETGYESYVAALPGGQLRSANLAMLLAQADAFARSSQTGLFRFLRYIDELSTYEIDYGEANVLSENADVVRIMSIHKSKGLEFPVCIVAGLGKRFNRRDLSGPLLCDMDRGLGADCVDTRLRIRETTLRREAVAEKLSRDSIGEEIRVLYVAMTRAKEKLILSGYFKNLASAEENASFASAGDKSGPLPVRAIEGASGFGELLLSALGSAGAGKVYTREVFRIAEIGTYREAEQDTLAGRKGQIEAALAGGTDASQDLPYRIPEEQLRFTYTHEDLKGLYTKTTVTELKEAYLNRLSDPEGTEQGAFLYHGERDAQEPETLAGFLAENGGQESGELSGASRGSAVHRLFELLDYGRFAGKETDAAE